MTNPLINIFLADDDAEDVEMFKETLQEIGFNVFLTVFKHGKAICSHIKERLVIPDIIFLDINMPFINGKDCVKSIRENQKFDGVLIIMYSTSVHTKDIDETFENGADLYVYKPNSYSSLNTILKDILARYLTGEFPNRNKEFYLYTPK